MRTRKQAGLGAAFVGTAVLLASWACDDRTSTILQPPGHRPDEAIERIDIVGSSEAIQVGDLTRLDAFFYCSHGLELRSVEPVWKTLTPEIVTIDPTGRVQGLRPGMAVIRATVDAVHHDHILRVDPYGVMIDRDGGTMSYHDGRVLVFVPSGAVTEEILLTVRDIDTPPVDGPGTSRVVPASAHAFGPSEMRFLNPVELRFAFEASDLPVGMNPLRLRVHRIADGRWVPLASSVVDVEAGAVSATTSHFSTFGLLDYRPEPGSIVVQPYETLLAVGETVDLAASITDGSGEAIVAPDITWSTSDPDVATVDTSGRVSAAGPGWSTISAESGDQVGSALVSVRSVITLARLEPDEVWLSPGESVRPTLVLEDETGQPVVQSADWSSNADAIASVGPDGTVRAASPGDAVIRAESGGAVAEFVVHVTTRPASIHVTPAAGYYPLGDTIRFTARVLDGAGDEVDRPVRWVSSEPSVLLEPGLVRATEPAVVVLTASSDKVSTTSVLTFVDAADLPGSIELSHGTIALGRGEAVQVTATVRDRLGVVVENPSIGWASGNPAVATVDPTGMVIAVREGTTLLTARSGHVVALAEIVVVPPGQRGPPNTVSIWPASLALSIGGTAALTATVYDDQGNALPGATVIWSSDQPGVVTVDESGLAIGVAEGTGVLYATSGSRAGSTEVMVMPADDGGHEEGLGNNLSWPVIFTEGYGMTGLPVATDPGIRPTPEEEVTVDALPFFAPTNVADYFAQSTDYFLQKSTNSWRAEWADGAGEIQSAEVKWGDNLVHHTFTTHSMVRVETVLTQLGGAEMQGFNMTHLYGARSTEMQGTDGTTGAFVPGLYTVNARLKIEKLDDVTLEPLFTAFDGSVAEGMESEGPGSYGAEVNVSGRIVYGYNFRVRDIAVPTGLQKYGWWRLTFSLDDAATLGAGTVLRGLSLDRCGNASAGDEELTYTPVLDTQNQTSTLDIWIASSSGGGGGGHSSGSETSGGSCGGH